MSTTTQSTGISDLIGQWRTIADKCDEVAKKHSATPNEANLAQEQRAFAYARRSCAQMLENLLAKQKPDGPARIRAALEALIGVKTRFELEQIKVALMEAASSAPDSEAMKTSIDACNALLETL